MPKSFDEFQSQKENYSDFKDHSVSVNPNITLNAETAKEIYHKNQVIFFTSMLGRAFSTIITGPLTTLQVSLQLSVLSHQDKYGDVTEVEKNQLMKTPKEITAYEKRRYELIVKSGVTGTNKPFRAPVYLNYREAFKALQNQGILGFYKGNFIGLCHVWMTTYMKFAVSNMINFKNYMKEKEDSLAFRGMFMFASSTMIDMFFHPLQTMQSRFILQNRLPNFRTYKSVFHFLRRHVKRPGAMLQGWGVHFPKNIMLSLGQVTLFQNDPLLAFVSSNIISQTLAYPLMTAMRRVQCQDKIAGMLPVRYEGIFHAVKLIAAEEGIRGLFRGYAAFLPGHLFTAFTLLGLNIVGEHTYSLKEQ